MPTMTSHSEGQLGLCTYLIYLHKFSNYPTKPLIFLSFCYMVRPLAKLDAQNYFQANLILDQYLRPPFAHLRCHNTFKLLWDPNYCFQTLRYSKRDIHYFALQQLYMLLFLLHLVNNIGSFLLHLVSNIGTQKKDVMIRHQHFDVCSWVKAQQ